MHWTSEHEGTRHGPGTIPSPQAIEAAVSLLVDPDPRVVAMCRRHILEWGRPAVAALQRAVKSSDPRLRLRARAVLRTVELALWVECVRRFARASSRAAGAAHRDHRVLETGALLVSALGRVQGIDRNAVAEALEQQADELRSLLRGRPRTAVRAARALRECLGRRQGYSSEHIDQFDTRSTLLDDVVKHRAGVPITLAIVYLLVGRRTGLSMTGVALPDHVLVRVHGARSVLIDPARGGISVTHADCVRGLRARGYTGASSTCMRELDDHGMLLGLLGSLRRVYGYREDGEVLQAIHRARALLSGDA